LAFSALTSSKGIDGRKVLPRPHFIISGCSPCGGGEIATLSILSGDGGEAVLSALLPGLWGDCQEDK
jgi:hypothetical protein